MAIRDGKLYVASSLAGNVVVVSTSGRIERVIKPQVPDGDEPLRLTGIAVTTRGEIWLSDPDNPALPVRWAWRASTIGKGSTKMRPRQPRLLQKKRRRR